MRNILTIAVLFLSSAAFSQMKVDSLWNEFQKADYLFRLQFDSANHYRNANNMEKAVYFILKAEKSLNQQQIILDQIKAARIKIENDIKGTGTKSNTWFDVDMGYVRGDSIYFYEHTDSVKVIPLKQLNLRTAAIKYNTN